MIRVAIIGAGIGGEHLEAYRALPDQYQVAMIIDLNTERAENLRRPGDTFQCAADMALTHGHDIDLVDICLPPHMHTGACISAGPIFPSATLERRWR